MKTPRKHEVPKSVQDFVPRTMRRKGLFIEYDMNGLRRVVLSTNVPGVRRGESFGSLSHMQSLLKAGGYRVADE